MLANFFSIGDRNYLNNAVVIADALERIICVFGDVKDFKIQFRKPFLSQGEFKISTEKLDGHITGQFTANKVVFYFSYMPTDIALEIRQASGHDVEKEISSFNVCYHITDICRGVIEAGFEKIYGPMTAKDKVIFAMFEIPNTSIFSSIIKNKSSLNMTVSEAWQTGDRRFAVSVYIDGDLLGHRYSTVREFIV
jgi:hypothetical protein